MLIHLREIHRKQQQKTIEMFTKICIINKNIVILRPFSASSHNSYNINNAKIHINQHILT